MLNPLNFLNRLFVKRLPAYVERGVSAVPGGRRLLNFLKSVTHYVMRSKNPLLQLFYLALVLGGYAIFLVRLLPHVPGNGILGPIHAYTSHMAVAFIMYTFYKASVVGPGNAFDVKHANCYAYDGFLYVHRDCRTCHKRKPARSKHCALCQTCVPRFDHHCPWINQCVGEDNYRWFLLFIGWNALFLTYASYVLGAILLWITVEQKLWSMQYTHRPSGKIVSASWQIVFQYMMAGFGLEMCLLVLCAVMAVVMYGFLGYHLHLIFENTTTNESEKWGGVEDYYRWLKNNPKEESSIKRESEVIRPDFPKALEDRKDEEFPETMPTNAYELGSYYKNLMEVIYPRSTTHAEAAATAAQPEKTKRKKKSAKKTR